MSLSISSRCLFIGLYLPQITQIYTDSGNLDFFQSAVICEICGSFSCRFQNVFDASDRDDDPAGTIIQFVADFIHGFVEQIGFEHDLKVFAVFRDENRASSPVQIALQKDAAYLAVPEV